jgi:hypothetical protein
MRYVKNPNSITHSQMLRNNPLIPNRHVKPGELSHLRILLMKLVKMSSLSQLTHTQFLRKLHSEMCIKKVD